MSLEEARGRVRAAPRRGAVPGNSRLAALAPKIAPVLVPLVVPALFPWLMAQALLTRRRAPVLPEAAGAREGRVGRGRALRLLIVGDSSAAGVGVPSQDRALAGHLTRPLAQWSGRRVDWVLRARSGVTTAQTLAMLRDEPPPPAEIAVVVLGVNDVIGRVRPARAVRQRAELAEWLMAHAGVRHVVFAPLPPVHRFPLLPQPLRWVMGTQALRHDEALARWAGTRRDVSHVPIELRLGVSAMAADGFHPGEPVYRRIGAALARHIVDRLLEPRETCQ